MTMFMIIENPKKSKINDETLSFLCKNYISRGGTQRFEEVMKYNEMIVLILVESIISNSQEGDI